MVEGYKRLIKKGELNDDFQDFTWLLFRHSKCFQSGEFHNMFQNICPNKNWSARDLGKGIFNVLSCNR